MYDITPVSAKPIQSYIGEASKRHPSISRLDKCKDDIYLSIDGVEVNSRITLWLTDETYKYINFDFSQFPKQIVITQTFPPVKQGDVVNKGLIRGYIIYCYMDGGYVSVIGDKYFEERR